MRISDWSSDVCSSDLFRTNQATLLEPDTQATQSSPEVGNKGVTSTRCRFVTTPGKVVTITAVAAPGARDAASIDVAITGCKFLKALEIFVQPAAILNPVVILFKNCIQTKPLSTDQIVIIRSTTEIGRASYRER